MNCPVDGTALAMTDRQGIEIDYCPKCRGVWLDRGELDKIIERSSTSSDEDDRREYRDEETDERRRHESNIPGKSRRKSILGDLFDFG